MFANLLFRHLPVASCDYVGFNSLSLDTTRSPRCTHVANTATGHNDIKKNLKTSWRDQIEPWVHHHLQDFFATKHWIRQPTAQQKIKHTPGVDTPTLGSPKTGVDTPPLDHQTSGGYPYPGSNTGVDTPPLDHQTSGGCPYPWITKTRSAYP